MDYKLDISKLDIKLDIVKLDFKVNRAKTDIRLNSKVGYKVGYNNIQFKVGWL